MNRWIRNSLVIAVCFGFWGTAVGQEIKWKMGHILAPDSSYLRSVLRIPDRISKATNGRVKIELFPTLVPGPKQPSAVRAGRLDLIAAVNPWLSGEAPILNIGHLPGLIEDAHQYKKVLDMYLAEEFAKVWDRKYNSKMVASGVFEKQVILSNKPLRKMEDFKGIKIRVHNTEAAQLMKAIGAKPTAISFREISMALQRGVVDAVMTSTGTSHGMGFYNVAKYINVWGIGTGVGYSIVINNDSWNRLPSDLQKAVQDEMKRIEADHYAEHDSYSELMTQNQIKKGMTLIVASQFERDRVFAPKNVKAVYDAWFSLNKENGFDGERVLKRVKQILGK